jgi:hypothetical protein
MKNIIIALSLSSVLYSCTKSEGPGGSSSIQGKVIGQNINLGRPEIIDLTVTSGAQIEHGDYFIINQPDGANYYFWFNNPTWVSNGDPQLAGRTGVSISFSYSDNDTTITNAVFNALSTHLSAQFNLSKNGDMIQLVSKSNINIADPDDVTTSFLLDVGQQGESDEIGAQTAITDERVYLIYGDGKNYNESTRTGADGMYSFDQLQKGEYQVYVLSKDLTTGEMTTTKLEKVTISEDKQLVEVPNLEIIH